MQNRQTQKDSAADAINAARINRRLNLGRRQKDYPTGSGKEETPQRGLKEGAVGVGGFSEGSWLMLVVTLSRKSAIGWNGHWGRRQGSGAPLHLNTGVCLPVGCVQLGAAKNTKIPH